VRVRQVKRMKFAGVVCDKCGVEVTPARVVAERMGHIELACRSAMCGSSKGCPAASPASRHVAAELEKSPVLRGVLVLESNHRRRSPRFPASRRRTRQRRKVRSSRRSTPRPLKVGMGAEASASCCATWTSLAARDLRPRCWGDLCPEAQEDRQAPQGHRGVPQVRQPAGLDDPRGSFPSSPPSCARCASDGGRFATSDLDDLVSRVINRNNRLKRLDGFESKAPRFMGASLS